jgi:Dolichyl-phosphate-mannose-protein mannosyltransferase
MTARELAESPPAARRGTSPSAGRRVAFQPGRAALIVTVATVVGAVLRVLVADQSLFADELSTYWISATHGLGGVLSLMYGTGPIKHAEISPPLPFLLSWLATRIAGTPELLRLPSLVAGIASIPLVYVLGLRTVGRRAALVATGLVTLSPFMIYYSANARGYALMMVAVMASTLAMLLALDTGQRRWWVLYAVSACVAFYSHYTSVFLLGAQFVWLLWARPDARRAMLVASLGAAAGVLPWLPGLINDSRSPTLKILQALSPFRANDIRIDLGHWAIGYPETFAGGLTRLPGSVALILFAAAVVIVIAGLLVALRGAPVRVRMAGLDRRVVLVIGLGLATPVAELVLGAAGKSVFSVRDLAASWPYVALAGAAAMGVLRARAAVPAAGLAVVALALGAATLLSAPFQRPDYQGAASYVLGHARPGDVVVDETGALSPGPLTGLDAALPAHLQGLRIFRAEAPAERDHPFGFLDPIISLQQGVDRAVAAARGHRVFVVTNGFATDIAGLAARVKPAPSHFPARYRLTAEQGYAGIGDTLVAVYTDAGARSK